MEAANEAARRAVNGILEADGYLGSTLPDLAAARAALTSAASPVRRSSVRSRDTVGSRPCCRSATAAVRESTRCCTRRRPDGRHHAGRPEGAADGRQYRGHLRAGHRHQWRRAIDGTGAARSGSAGGDGRRPISRPRGRPAADCAGQGAASGADGHGRRPCGEAEPARPDSPSGFAGIVRWRLRAAATRFRDRAAAVPLRTDPGVRRPAKQRAASGAVPRDLPRARGDARRRCFRQPPGSSCCTTRSSCTTTSRTAASTRRGLPTLHRIRRHAAGREHRRHDERARDAAVSRQ